MKLTKNQRKVLEFIKTNSPVSIFSIQIAGMSRGWTMNAVYKLWQADLIEYVGKSEVSFVTNK